MKNKFYTHFFHTPPGRGILASHDMMLLMSYRNKVYNDLIERIDKLNVEEIKEVNHV